MSPYIPPGRKAALSGKRILVVEDEGLVALLVQDGLADAGAEVIGPVGSVADALQLVKQAIDDGGISGAVLDLNLGGEPVFPVADALVRLGVPFLFETGYGDDCDTGGHTAAPVLHKPYGTQRLVGAVEALVSSGR
jgi:DNA-binding response OmpR family regulator